MDFHVVIDESKILPLLRRVFVMAFKAKSFGREFVDVCGRFHFKPIFQLFRSSMDL